MELLAPPGGWKALVEQGLVRVCEQLGGDHLPDAWLPRLGVLAELLELVRLWNRRVNLTGARGAEQLADLFLADAAVLAAVEVSRLRPGSSWVDVGSGAGAPGLPLAVLAPELDLTLVEPRAKRVAFLRTALGSLRITGAHVECTRSERLADAQWDVAVSRAAMAPERWLPEGARLARRSVWLLTARGEPLTWKGWEPADDIGYHWPLTGAERRAVRFRRAYGEQADR